MTIKQALLDLGVLDKGTYFAEALDEMVPDGWHPIDYRPGRSGDRWLYRDSGSLGPDGGDTGSISVIIVSQEPIGQDLGLEV